MGLKVCKMEKENNRKSAGRKQNKEITNNSMILWIDKYTKEFPNQEIKISKLARFSGIERHYWYDREGVIEYIHKINDLKYGDYESRIDSNSKNLLELPDIDSLIENNYRSKKKLKDIMSSYFNLIQEFYDSACKAHELQKEFKKIAKENEIIKTKLEKVKSDKECLEKQVDAYKNQLRVMTVRSREVAFSKENNIKQNILELNDGKRAYLTTKNSELKKMLDSLGNTE